jgi:hypothetical protein
MPNSWSLAVDNLTSVAVLAFVFGAIAARFRSDVRMPDQVYQFISIYLLFGIGLKGGHAIRSVQVSEIISPALLTLLIGSLVPLAAFSVLKLVRTLSALDRGAIAAHYGSTSLVTFSAALLFLETNVIEVEGFATVLLVLMEIPGLVVGIYLGSRHLNENVEWKETLIEVLTGKTVLLLVGGLIIGSITSEAGYEKVAPLFVGILSGLLALFLMHLGYLAGSNFSEIKSVGPKVAVFGIVFPIVVGSLAVIAAHAIGMSVGGATILGVLTASASYIAAPDALSIGLPTANSSLALMSSIGVTFPFNLIFGIPLYFEIASTLG